jgi:hypothetical protein
LLWLCMEEVCNFEPADHAAVFSDNSPAVSWTDRLATRGSKVSDQFVQALGLRMKEKGVSPLTPLHIKGEENQMTDIPSRSYGSEPSIWYCETEEDLLTLFNDFSPFQRRALGRSSTRLKRYNLVSYWCCKQEEWRQLPKAGKNIDTSGEPTAKLWEWTLFYRKSPSSEPTQPSSPSQLESNQASTAQAMLSELELFQRRCRPSTRRSQWQHTRNL